jgi:hypothetical protein
MKDGVPQQLQLHHSRQNGKGPLFELSRKTHLTTLKGKGREAVHPYGHNQHPDEPVNRELSRKKSRNIGKTAQRRPLNDTVQIKITN